MGPVVPVLLAVHTAAVWLAIHAMLPGEVDATLPSCAKILIEIGYPILFSKGKAKIFQCFVVLVTTIEKSCGKRIETFFSCPARDLFHTPGITDGTTLLFMKSDPAGKLGKPISSLINNRYIEGSAIVDERLLTTLEFLEWVNVGVKEDSRNVMILPQPLNRINGAWAAAGMKKKSHVRFYTF